METDKTWLGCSVPDLCKNKGPWSFAVSPILPSKFHHVLYQLPVTLKGAPKPHIPSQTFHWDEDYVRIPYSTNNVFPVTENGISVLKSRWRLICNSLSKPIKTSKEFEAAVRSYNKNLPKFTVLHSYFNHEIEEEEADYFFDNILPGIIKLALQLPDILPGNLPLLKKNHCKSVSLSQLQIASLLANAFLCTFPWRKDMASYPGVNFYSFYSTEANYSVEKLKCIFNYFRRVIANSPIGVITFERKFIPKTNMPRWDSLQNNLGNLKIHINSAGTIEDDGLGFLQVDFANKNIGGGVLGYGCVQEEIRFVICPELIVARLFVEQLGDHEALIVTGAEQYNCYKGYSDSFEWSGNHRDETPFDEYGRRRTTISAIDATYYARPKDQFFPSSILRETNKAYVGFHCREKENLAPVASGNWGCGAFRGDARLKSLIQLMACCASGRDLAYYSFGDEELRDELYNMYLFLANNSITIKQLWRFLGRFSSSSLPQENLFSFIQQSFFDSKNQPSIKKFFTRSSKEEKIVAPSTSSSVDVNSPPEDTVIDIEPTETMDCDLEEDIIPATPPEESPSKPKRSFKTPKKPKEQLSPNNHDEIVRLLGFVDGNANKGSEETFLSEFDKLRKNPKTEQIEEVTEKNIENMEVDLTTTPDKSNKRKITDYFSKTTRS